jgi:hypothetical protein
MMTAVSRMSSPRGSFGWTGEINILFSSLTGTYGKDYKLSCGPQKNLYTLNAECVVLPPA